MLPPDGRKLNCLADLDTYLERGGGGMISCKLCSIYRNRTVTNVRMHIESKHFPGLFAYTCSMCSREFNTTLAYTRHKKKCDTSSIYDADYS